MPMVVCNILLYTSTLCLFNEVEILVIYKWIMPFDVQM